MQYCAFVERTLKKAAGIALEKYGHVEATIKPHDRNQVLTQADIAVGNFIIEQIQKMYPEHNIIDEEAGVIDKKSAFTWVIDPIDGTSNFAVAVPTYGILLGLLHNGHPVAGGAMLPAFGDFYYAEKGKGVCRNGEDIHVTEVQDLMRVLVAFHVDGHEENFTKKDNEARILENVALHCLNIRSSNSIFDIMLVADGRYGGVVNRSSKVWDNVASQIIVEEAGGVYTNFFGKAMDYYDCLQNPQKNMTFCAGSPLLHEALQKIIHG